MTTVAESGRFHFMIDGTDLTLPSQLDERNELMLAVQESGTGRRSVEIPYQGDGLPDVSDRYEWAVDWQLADESVDGTTITFLERLRTAGGTHVLTDWKKRVYKYTARSGQVFFYLPRPDAYGRDYAGYAGSEFKAVVTVNGASKTVAYQNVVGSGESVTAGNVKIAKVATTHPESGWSVCTFKLGDNPGAGGIVLVEFVPLFNVYVTGVPTKPFESASIREDKTLFLLEVN